MRSIKMKAVFQLAIILTMMLVAAICYYSDWVRGNPRKMKTDYKVKSKQLARAYTEDSEAQATYFGKVLEVEGKVLGEQILPGGEHLIILEGDGNSTVQCKLLTNEKL